MNLNNKLASHTNDVYILNRLKHISFKLNNYSLYFRFINDYSKFSQFITMFMSNLNKRNRIGFVQLDLADWDFVFVKLLII